MERWMFFTGNLRFQPFDPTNGTVFFLGHSGVVHCFDLCLSENLLVSGGEDWKLISWKFAEGELIKIFSSHSAAVLELKLEQITESSRSYARHGLSILLINLILNSVIKYFYLQMAS